MNYVVVKDIGTPEQRVASSWDSKDKAQVAAGHHGPGHTVHPHDAVIDWSVPHQIGEEFPLRHYCTQT